MAGRLHGGKAGLDAFADHQHVAGFGEAHRTATTWTEHHLLRLDRRLSDRRRGRGRCGELRAALPSAPCVTSATIAGQMPPEGCFRPGWKRRRVGGGRSMPREREIGLDRRSLGRLGGLPDGERRLAAPGVVGSGLRSTGVRRGACAKASRATAVGPQAALSKGGDHSRWSQPAWQRTSTLPSCRVADRKARRAIVMRRAARHPAAARLAPAEGLGDGFSGHGAPRRWAARKASVGGLPSRLGSVYRTS